MLDVHLRRPADRRLPGRHADGHLLRLRPEPAASCASATSRRMTWSSRPGPSSDTFAFNGRFNQQRYVNIWPRPVQQPHPPIWIPGGGSVETWQWCAEMDYVYCYLSYYGYKAGKATMDGFWAEMDRLGKDRNPYRAGFAAGGRRRPKAASRRSSSIPSPPSISSTAACMSIRASPRRPATAPRRRSAPASKAR